jgi:hypothetical protein
MDDFSAQQTAGGKTEARAPKVLEYDQLRKRRPQVQPIEVCSPRLSRISVLWMPRAWALNIDEAWTLGLT